MIIQRRITKETIDAIPSPKRICFSSFHKNSLKKDTTGSKWIGKFTIPFSDTILPIFVSYTGITLFESRFGGHWVSVQSEDDFELIDKFVTDFNNIVFLRDTLALSIALAENFSEDGQSRTEIGQLEFLAKYWGKEEAIQRLSIECIDTINRLPFYKDINIFCGVPPSDNKTQNLPSKIIERIGLSYDINDITPNIRWRNPKESLKSLPKEEKWQALISADLQVDTDLSGQTIILIDDLYQSGLTIQYIAMKLIEAGADRIYGVCLVKSRSDSDNS